MNNQNRVELPSQYYLAGPMSGIAGHNFKTFDAIAQALRKRGYRVVNPAELTRQLPGQPGDLPYETYVRHDFKHLLDCTDLVLMGGWMKSRGARMELVIAEFLKMRVWYVNADFKLSRMPYGNRDA